MPILLESRYTELRDRQKSMHSCCSSGCRTIHTVRDRNSPIAVHNFAFAGVAKPRLIPQAKLRITLSRIRALLCKATWTQGRGWPSELLFIKSAAMVVLGLPSKGMLNRGFAQLHAAPRRPHVIPVSALACHTEPRAGLCHLTSCHSAAVKVSCNGMNACPRCGRMPSSWPHRRRYLIAQWLTLQSP